MKTHARLIITLALAAFAALGLSACATKPAAPAAPAVAAPSTVELMLKVRAAELELERIDKMSWLKFAEESGSDMVKGFVMGKASGGSAAPAASSTTQTIMQAQAQADATALRREELAAENSFENKAFRWVGLGLDTARFYRGLNFQEFQIRESNAQSRYTTDALRGTQQDGYSFNSRIPYYFVLPAGSTGVAPVAATE